MVAGQLARTLGDSIEVTWAASDASPPPKDVPALPLRASNMIERRSGLPFPIPTAVSLIRLIGAVRRSDAVLVHDGMYPTSIAAIVTARLLGRPAALVQHIGHVPTTSTGMKLLFGAADRLLTRPMLRITSQVVFISETTARHFAGVRMRRVPALIFNGVDSAVFRPSTSSEEHQRDRERASWPENRPVILFVGRFLEKKGLLRLKEMAALRHDIHWAFAGWGPCDPSGWDLPNVSVHRNCTATQLASFYRAADLLVLPSKSEGFPLVVQEALACGLRPVCCADAANADPAAAPHMSIVAETSDEVDVVRRYLEAIAAALPLSSEGRTERAEFAREHYSWPAAGQQYRAILRALWSESSAPKFARKATA
jgi:glycosyltransferase involved in cell wall biosynthesis